MVNDKHNRGIMISYEYLRGKAPVFTERKGSRHAQNARSKTHIYLSCLAALEERQFSSMAHLKLNKGSIFISM